MFRNANWISSPVPTNDNILYRFRKTIKIEATENVTADIFADSRYKLYINGCYVCEGPCIGTVSYYDTVDISNYLCVGENVIEAVVLYLGKGEGASCINRKNRVAFLFEAYQNGASIIKTDVTWDCAIDKSYTFYMSEHMHPNGYLNESYKRIEIEWGRAELVPFAFGDKQWGVLPYYELRPRPIKMYVPFKNCAMSVSKSNMHGGLKKGEKGYVVYDVGRHKTGYPVFEFKGSADVVITYAESYVFNSEGRYIKKVRSDKTGDIVGASDQLHIRENNFTFCPFLTKTARYIKVEISAVTDFEINRADFAQYRYPFTVKNEFTCSDECYNEIFKISVNTLENCMFDTYVDCPYYEMQQYTEDAYLEMMYSFMLSDDYSMPKKLITDLWQSINYEGMQTAAAPMEYKQITPTFCFFWIMMLDKYMLYTGDSDTVKPMLSGVYSILLWFENYLDVDGVVGVYDYGKFIDWSSGWESGFSVDNAMEAPTSVASLMYMAALKTGADLFRKFGKNGIADDLMRVYEGVRHSVNETFYDTSAKLYRDTKCGKFSEHSQIWAILSEAVIGDDARNVLSACDCGNVSRCSYSYRFFKNRAYEKCGMDIDMDSFLVDWQNMLKLDATTWFESPGDARSDCHAWSSVPIYEFTTRILGITPISDGCSEVLIKPKFGTLEYASGTMPTPHGDISVSWKKTDGTYELKVEAPANIKIHYDKETGVYK